MWKWITQKAVISRKMIMSGIFSPFTKVGADFRIIELLKTSTWWNEFMLHCSGAFLQMIELKTVLSLLPSGLWSGSMSGSWLRVGPSSCLELGNVFRWREKVKKSNNLLFVVLHMNLMPCSEPEIFHKKKSKMPLIN